jgi:hypothetical protein
MSAVLNRNETDDCGFILAGADQRNGDVDQPEFIFLSLHKSQWVLNTLRGFRELRKGTNTLAVSHLPPTRLIAPHLPYSNGENLL